MDVARRSYLEALRDVIVQIIGPDGGVWLYGSVVLDDEAARSDLDIMVSVTEPPAESRVRRLIEDLRHESIPCPYMGLDLGLFLASVVKAPPRVPPCILAITTGREWPLDISRDGLDAGSILDLALCRQSGRSLAGVEPAEGIGEIPREWIEQEARAAVEWHRGFVHHGFHDPLGDQAVLNACRAWRLLEEGNFSSKTSAGEWARRKARDRDVIGKALEARAGRFAAPMDRAEVLDFLDWVLGRLGVKEA